MKLVDFVATFNQILGCTIAALYLYQVGYLVVGMLRRNWRDLHKASRLRRYGVLISARNEEEVIGELIGSLHAQHYPADLLDIYVVADNCTDRTAEVAKAAGATVYRRFNRVEVGKGYALDFLLKKLMEDGLFDRDEGFFVFDADNIVDSNFVAEMNRTYDSGKFVAVTGYRNSKNFGDNWISAANSIWFLREARFLNSARMALGVTCHVSGTGFLISSDVIREKGGWPYHLMTEDLQFSAECAAMGKKVGYCEGAVIYDEQPTSFRQSWDQRMRWAKGFYQVSGRYGLSLLKGTLRGGRRGMGCYDIFMLVAPGMLLTTLGSAFQIVTLAAYLMAPDYAVPQVLNLATDFLGAGFLSFYGGMLLYGVVTVVSEWGKIRAKTWQKLVYIPLFPIFMFSYFPLTIAALFQKVEWKPIQHKSVAQLDRAA